LLLACAKSTAKRGEAAGCEARAAEKGSAIHTAGLGTETIGQGATSCRAFSSFDQHELFFRAG
jgi:hypothetical protein